MKIPSRLLLAISSLALVNGAAFAAEGTGTVPHYDLQVKDNDPQAAVDCYSKGAENCDGLFANGFAPLVENSIRGNANMLQAVESAGAESEASATTYDNSTEPLLTGGLNDNPEKGDSSDSDTLLNNESIDLGSK